MLQLVLQPVPVCLPNSNLCPTVQLSMSIPVLELLLRKQLQPTTGNNIDFPLIHESILQVIVLQQQDNCQNQCQSSCMNTCQSSATVLQCQPICQQTCQNTCQQAAQIVVPCQSSSSGCGCSSGYSQCGGSCCRRR